MLNSSFVGFFRRLRFLIHRNRLHRDMEEEMRLHIEQRARQQGGRGLSPENSREAAQRRFGNRTALGEQAREAWIPPALESMIQDVRYAWRGLRRNPSFSLTTILVIALGIGASTAVFSVVDRLLFRSLPYPDADRLVSVGITAPILLGGDFLTANDYLQLRDVQTPFSTLASMTGVADCDLTEDHPLRLDCAQVDSAFLPTFGVQPFLGRNFTREEDRPNVPKVALVSYGFWRSRLGGDPNVLGKTIPIDGTTTRVIGVLPQSFEMPNLVHADLVVPQAVALTGYRPGQSGRPLRVFGRLKPGVTIPQAFSQLQPYFRQEINIVPPAFQKSVHPTLRSLRDYQIKNVKAAAWMLLGGTLTILFIVCANVASLLLARSVARARELAVRSALGAGRWRLMRQIFTESGLLSLIGGITGCALASSLLQIFKALAPTSIPRLQQAALDGPILLFALAVTLACGVLFGLAPAFRSPRPATLAGRGAVGSSRTSLRHLLITAQIALSLVLLSVAGLLLESLWKLENVAPGISTSHVLTADITVSPHRYPNSASRGQFFDDLRDRLKTLPGVAAVAVSDTVPPSGMVQSRPISMLQVDGRPPLPLGAGGLVDWRSVTPDYFKVLGIFILRGTGFQEKDRVSKAAEYILSDSLARRLFGKEDPIGQTIHYGRPNSDGIVVGVAADVKNNGLTGKSDPEYYVLRRKIEDPNAGRDEGLTSLSLHAYDGHAVVIVRTTLQPEIAAKWIRSETAALDSTTPVTVSTVSSQIRRLSERPRFNALLLSSFALVGLLLASAGLYGLISYLVVQRRQEIGVRMAVGATPRQIASLILNHALRWTAAGIAVGLLGTLVATRFLGSLLFEVSPENPILFSGAAVILLLISVAATLLPALRASRIDPMVVLRQE